MNCPTCGAKLEIYSPGRVDPDDVEWSPGFPEALKSEVLRLFESVREAWFKCSGRVEHYFKPSDFPEAERRELERENLRSIEASKLNRERLRREQM